MACPRCLFKGYVETTVFRDNGMKPLIRQCTGCNDVKRYSRRVQELAGTPETKRTEPKPGVVVLLRKRNEAS